MIRIGKKQPGDSSSYDHVVELPPVSAQWVAAAEDLDRAHPITHVVAFHEFNVEYASAIAERLHLPFHSIGTVRGVRDKATMRAKLPADLSPEWKLCRSFAQVRKTVAGMHGGCVIKPVSGSGSEGVIVLTPHMGDAIADEYVLTAEAAGGPWLVERQVLGREISVEAFSEDGAHVIIGSTEKFHFPDSVVEQGHVFPFFPDLIRPEIVADAVRRTLSSLGIRHGPSHTELILSVDGPVVVETHLRPGGDHIPLMIEDVTGTSIIGLWIAQSLGAHVLSQVPSVGRAPGIYSASWYRGAASTGSAWVVEDLDAVVATLRDEGMDVRALESRFPQGATVAPPRRSADRLLVARACSATSRGAALAASIAAARPTVEISSSSKKPVR